MNAKPLLKKVYGSIGHLPGSKLGSGDRTINDGQYKLCCVKARKSDVIIVQEKLDGSCCGVARVDGKLIPLGRKGYMALSSPREQHVLFHNWVMERIEKFEWLNEGERVVGEWLALAHGTKYDLTGRDPFVVFDIFDKNNKRKTVDETINYCFDNELAHVPILHSGDAISVEEIKDILQKSRYGAEQPEGAIWRVETVNKRIHRTFNLIAKYVRNDYITSKYSEEEIWNWRP